MKSRENEKRIQMSVGLYGCPQALFAINPVFFVVKTHFWVLFGMLVLKIVVFFSDIFRFRVFRELLH